MTYDEYVALPGVRASDLKLLRESPAHYRYPATNTDTVSRKILRAIHCAVLEGPAEFRKQFVYYPEHRRGAEYTRFVYANPGATVLTQKEATTVSETAAHICAHRDAGPLFTGNGHSELTIQWDNPETGIKCKARIDRLTGDRVIIDLKSYGTTDPRMVSTMAESKGAFVQLAHYEEGVRVALGVADSRVMIVSAETTPPYDVAVFEVADIESAIAERDKLMLQLRACQEYNFWPGRHTGIQSLARPWWANTSVGGGTRDQLA